MADGIFILTTGTMGAGKTHARVAWVVDQLMDDDQAILITNLPLNVEECALYVSKKFKRDLESCRKQFRLIEKEELSIWRSGKGGPWEYFETKDMSMVHFIIDEAHAYCSNEHAKDIQHSWNEWISEVRHQGATMEFITQDEASLPSQVNKRIEYSYMVSDCASMRDPFFGIQWDDVFQVIAKFTGLYLSYTMLMQYRKLGKSRPELKQRFFYPRFTRYFKLYNSFSETQAGGKSGEPRRHPYQRKGYIELLLWVTKRNLWRLAVAPTTYIMIAAFVLINYGGDLFGAVMNTFKKGAQSHMAKGIETKEENAPGYNGEWKEIPVEKHNHKAYAEQLDKEIRGGELNQNRMTKDELRQLITKQEQRISALRLKLTGAYHGVQKQKKLIYKLNELLGRGVRIKSISAEGFTMANGDHYKIGDTIIRGPYVGVSVVGTHVPSRRVLLANGVVLFILDNVDSVEYVGLQKQIAEFESEFADAISGEVPPATIQAVVQETENGKVFERVRQNEDDRKNSDDVGKRDAGQPIHSRFVPRDRSINNRVSRARLEARNIGRKQTAGKSSSSNIGTPTRR